MWSDNASVYKPVFESTQDFVSRTKIDADLRHTYVKPILTTLRQAANIRLTTVRQLTCCAELFPSTFSERFCETIQVSFFTLCKTGIFHFSFLIYTRFFLY